MKEYSNSVLQKLCEMIREEEGAQQWLVDNGYRELSEFWDAYEDVEKSFQWLKNNGFLHFAALVDAMSGNEQAKMWLMQSNHMVLAVFADAAEGNKSAVMWMLKSGEKGWLAVAKEIYDYEKKKRKKGIWSIFNFGNPYK